MTKMRFASIFNFFLLIIATCLDCDGNQNPSVRLKSGVIEGVWKTSLNGRRYASFEGIPYAKPPLGQLRFKEPEPIESWMGTWKAIKSYKCIQTDLFLRGVEPNGEEDCLYLNVYVADVVNKENLDVLVHIHGGGFIAGHATKYINASSLMDKDWIVVSINYRLGALGFLCTEDFVVPGNNGLKDQQLALRWIRDNIKRFGGNPNSVTLHGFSAGAASVHLHYFSPKSRGLFHKGMSNSGTALASWALAVEPLNTAKKLASELGCDVGDNKEMIECLREKPASAIVVITEKALGNFPMTPLVTFAPVVEKPHENAFLVRTPYEMLKNGDVLDRPWITSHTSDDGLLIAVIPEEMFDEYENNFSLIKYLLQCHKTIPEGREDDVISKIKNYYFKDGVYDKSKFATIFKIVTHRMFSVPGEQSAQLQAAVTKSPVYYYVFSYEGRNSIITQLGVTKYKGVGHGDDVSYLIGGRLNKEMTEGEKNLKNLCHDILYSYAHNGIPSLKNNTIKWEPVTEKLNYLNFISPDEIKMETKTDFSENEVWMRLGLKENEYFDRNKKIEL